MIPTPETRPYRDVLEIPIATEREQIRERTAAYIAPRNAPELYPGDHPETTGYMVDAHSKMVYGIRWNSDSTLWVNRGEFAPVIDQTDERGSILTASVDEWLQEKGAPTLKDRYLLTVFGSNRSPGQLVNKFQGALKKRGEADIAQKLLYVPMINGLLRGFDGVYNSTLGNLGYGYADLYEGAETRDTEVEVSVAFLTAEQLQIIHESERDYDFAVLGKVQMGSLIYNTLEDAPEVPAFCHIGKASVYAIEDDNGAPHPIALGEIYARNRGLKDMGQRDFQEFHLAQGDVWSKAAVMGVARALKGMGITNQDQLQHIDPNNPHFVLEILAAHARPQLDSEAYRQIIKTGGELGSIDLRRQLKAWLNQYTPDENRMKVDPAKASRVKVISKDISKLPGWGDILQGLS